jgi:hypothetical protein
MNPQEYPESKNGGNTEMIRRPAVAIEEQKEDDEMPRSTSTRRSAFATRDQANEAERPVGYSTRELLLPPPV